MSFSCGRDARGMGYSLRPLLWLVSAGDASQSGSNPIRAVGGAQLPAANPGYTIPLSEPSRMLRSPTCTRATIVASRGTAVAQLPERVHRLTELAHDLWWSWTPDARNIFRRLDYPL